MKCSTSDHGNFLPMPSEMLINSLDTVLESTYDQGGQQTGLVNTSWTRRQKHWQKQRLFRQKDSGKSLEAKLLALGTTTVLATMMPLAAEAKIIAFENQSVNLLLSQSLDIDGDEIPDLLCFYSITDNGNMLLSCMDINGEGLSVNSDPCGPDEANDNEPQNQPQNDCQTNAGSASKYLLSPIKTSRDLNAWVKVKMDSDKSLAIAESWAYEDCVGQPIQVGQTSGGVTGCSTNPVVEPVTTPGTSPAVVNPDNQVTLTWADHNSNETGFKIYRDGKLIATLPANTTSYTDTSLPCAANSPYIYEIRVANSQGDSEPAAVTVTIGNICPSRGAMLFTAADGTGSGKVGSSPGGLSCEVKDCHDDPKDSSHQICDKDKCNVQLEKLTVVKLIPQADSGSYFSSWGGHEDCTDGEVVMTENKLCVAYFRTGESPAELPSLSDGKKDSTRLLPLPSMVGMEICPDGKQYGDTAAQFNGGVLINGQGDFETAATVTTTDGLEILGRIKLAPLHLPLLMDVFVHASYQATDQAPASYWMMDENRQILPWDKAPANLEPFLRGVAPSATDELFVKIYQGTLSVKGIVEITFGYRLSEGTMVCVSPPIKLDIK